MLEMTLAAENALNSPQRRGDCVRESSNTRGINCEYAELKGYQTVIVHSFILFDLVYFHSLSGL